MQDAASGTGAAVITSFWRSALFGYGKPPFRASFRAARASLYTTRAHPNVRASAARWPTVG